MSGVVDIKKARNIGREGQIIYDTLRNDLESNHSGKIVAIEVDSKDHFIGTNLHGAIESARKKHPDKVFYTIRIGQPSVYTFTSASSISGTATTTSTSTSPSVSPSTSPSVSPSPSEDNPS